MFPNNVDFERHASLSVAIILCVKSVESWSSVDDSSLKTLLLPSLASTISSGELDKFSVELFIAYDRGDHFWERDQNRKALVAGESIPINFVSVNQKRANHIPFNEIAWVAYSYGADFFVRVNDDTEFVSKAWLSRGIRALANLNPPLVGVVGPVCDKSPPNILTHDMVHATHLEIFHTYYPEEFDNWFIDDWISSVYGADRTVRVSDWTIKHHIDRHGTRYYHDDSLKKHLPVLVQSGERRVEAYVESLNFLPMPRKWDARPSPCLMHAIEIKADRIRTALGCT
jgi:hypothetical protein